MAVGAVLLVAYVFVSTAHAESIKKQESFEMQLSKSREEASKTKTQLQESNTKAESLNKEVQARDARIHQLEQENSELKE